MTTLTEITSLTQDTTVRVHGFFQNIRVQGKRAFIVLRSGIHTIQCAVSKLQNEEICVTEIEFEAIKKISTESVVEIEGVAKTTNFDIFSATVKRMEICVKKVTVLSAANALPFEVNKKDEKVKKEVKNEEIKNEEIKKEVKDNKIKKEKIKKEIKDDKIKNEKDDEIKNEKDDEIKNENKNEIKGSKDDENLNKKVENLGLNKKIGYSKLLDFRSLDLRNVHSASIFRLVDIAMHEFRSFLRKNDFVEIKTSKLIETTTEGGANCFELKYFKTKAYLAQSPQLYKQMAIIGGLKKVYEIGHVYRAEESNINRYLSEFVGLDIEMEVENLDELINFVHSVLFGIFEGLKKSGEILENVKKFKNFEIPVYGEKPIVFSYGECVKMLQASGNSILMGDDFNREAEKKLGEIVKEKNGVDLFVVRDYPASVRAFYTKKHESDEFSYSYDFILRGEEILSGAIRENVHEKLIENVIGKGVDPKSLEGYLNSFLYGVPLHGGCGMGLERILKAFFDFDDIRYFSMFPREPNRLYP